MVKKVADNAKKKEIPRIEFHPDVHVIKSGKSVILNWKVDNSEEVHFYQDLALTTKAAPINWWRITKLASEIKNEGSLKVSPKNASAYYIIGKSKKGWQGRSVNIGITKNTKVNKEPSWCIDNSNARLMRSDPSDTTASFKFNSNRPFVSEFQFANQLHHLFDQIVLYDYGDPTISFNTNTDLVFNGENFTLSWTVQDSDCAEMSEEGWGPTLVEDTTEVPGTRIAGGWGEGADSPACSLENEGSFTGYIGGPVGPPGGGFRSYIISAKNASMRSARAAISIHHLPKPSFIGSTNSSRENLILSLVREAFRKLKNGGIINNPSLDETIPAFKDGHLNRVSFYHRLCAEFYNMHLIKINVVEYPEGTDPDSISWGHWNPYSNTIIIEFIAGLDQAANAYCVLHEFCHKAGFNNDLLPYYSGYDKNDPNCIEFQTAHVAGSCF
jgi:hypothetical protein